RNTITEKDKGRHRRDIIIVRRIGALINVNLEKLDTTSRVLMRETLKDGRNSLTRSTPKKRETNQKSVQSSIRAALPTGSKVDYHQTGTAELLEKVIIILNVNHNHGEIQS